MELGRVDTLVLTLSKNQDAADLRQIPDSRGSTLYRLLTDPDNVNLEFLLADVFVVLTFLLFTAKKQLERLNVADNTVNFLLLILSHICVNHSSDMFY